MEMKGDAKGKSAKRQSLVLYPVASDPRYFDICMILLITIIGRYEGRRRAEKEVQKEPKDRSHVGHLSNLGRVLSSDYAGIRIIFVVQTDTKVQKGDKKGEYFFY